MDSDVDSGSIAKEIEQGVFTSLEIEIISEVILREISGRLLEKNKTNAITKSLIQGIPNGNRNYDWNVGSILRHFPANSLVETLGVMENAPLHNSIGLTWVLGELKNQHWIIVNYLRSTIVHARCSDAWWRAAFSLESLGLGDAINILKMSLKGHRLSELRENLLHLDDKRCIVGILIQSNVDNIEKEIYPLLKKRFLESEQIAETVNCCWLLGRLRLIDNDIYDHLLKLSGSENHEIKYYTFFALQNNANETLRPVFERALKDQDSLIRKMATRGLLTIGNEAARQNIETALAVEQEEDVIGEMSQAIYCLKNPYDRNRLLIESRAFRNENGMISDESDKWYSDPAIYHTFSESEDPENVCLNLVLRNMKGHTFRNPIDLGTGTGRMIWPIMDTLRYQGRFYAVDASEKMCDFLLKNSKRERKFTHNLSVIRSTIEDAPLHISDVSTFILSSFGFPSHISNKKRCSKELQAVDHLLADDGYFVTIGWDETFNDELSEMWYRFIPDDIQANTFEDWRQQRVARIQSPRNCGLTWFKRGIRVPLQFDSLKESANVMGYLFGRDAAQYVVSTGRTEWIMSLGITCDRKQDLQAIIQKYEGN